MFARIVEIAIAILILGALFGVLERCWPAIRGQRRPPGSQTTDLGYWFFTPIVADFITKLGVALALALLIWLLGERPNQTAIEAFVYRDTSHIQTWPLGWQVLAALVLGDFIGYWQHRWFHRGKQWRFHAVHHSSTALNWFSAIRLHPVNEVIGRVVQVIPLVLLGFNPLILAGYTPFFTLYALLLHANVPWDFGPARYILASPTFHRWHHANTSAARDRNFAGLFPVWDWFFGTLYLPARQQPQTFGVNDPIPTTMWRQLAWPFTAAR